MGPKPIALYNDQMVVERILAGESQMFSLLLDRYGSLVAARMSQLVPPQHAQDMVQEVFLALYDSLGSVDAANGLNGFIRTLCVRRAHDFWRKAANRETPLSQHTENHTQWLDGRDIAWASDGAYDPAQLVEQRNLLENILSRVSATDRMLLVLVWLEEHTVAEAAKQLGISLPNAKIRIYRCRKRLRVILNKLLGEEP